MPTSAAYYLKSGDRVEFQDVWQIGNDIVDRRLATAVEVVNSQGWVTVL